MGMANSDDEAEIRRQHDLLKRLEREEGYPEDRPMTEEQYAWRINEAVEKYGGGARGARVNGKWEKF